LNEYRMKALKMYLLDTNVISELRKKSKTNKGVKAFFKKAKLEQSHLYLSVVTIGELRRGIELVKHRGDIEQSALLDEWLIEVIEGYSRFILDFTALEAQVWGRLRVPSHENAIDKQIAATALTYDLCLVTRNIDDFVGTGVRLLNPFD